MINIALANAFNGMPLARSAVPVLAIDDFREVVVHAVADGGRLSALFGYPMDQACEKIRLMAVLARPHRGILEIVAADPGERYHSLTPDCTPAHWFEREIAEQWGITPEGHPWLKPIRYHRAMRGHDAWSRPPEVPIQPGVTDFFRVEGDEVHEVAVGPVHAGVIEPGHFSFQCHGENVFHLEIALGYQHRGVERALVGGPSSRTRHLMETLAGDTTTGHTLAYCQLVEGMTNCHVPGRGLSLRGIALEIERLANHTGDLGALANDVGFQPTASYCGRLRGDFLNLTALLCGNRFGRGMVIPGGVAFDLDPERAAIFSARLEVAARELENAVNLLWASSSVIARFEEAGIVSRETARDLGLVGPAARASGVGTDVRKEFPTGIFRFFHVPVSTWSSSDVFGRAYVRWLEIQRSLDFIRDLVKSLPGGGVLGHHQLPLPPNQLVVSLIEGWRGEICHVAQTDDAGRFAWYKVIDPSFHNWMGLAMALRNQPISDFPVCNKSFNLSYCGHDL